MIAHTRHLGNGRTLHQYRGSASNQYILENHAAGSSFLVDCGMPSDVKGLTHALNGMAPLKRVVCTHFHVDHVSGWIQLKKHFAAAELWLSKKAEPLVKGRQKIPMPDVRAWTEVLFPCMRESGYLPGLTDLFKGGLYATPFKQGFPEDRIHYFTGRDAVLPGFETLPTPGHRPDHMAFCDPQHGVLICGDALIVINGHIVPNRFLASPKDQAASLNSIRSTPGILSLWPGHGPVTPFCYQAVSG